MKKIIAILIILALVFSLTACGKETDTTRDTQEPTTTVYLKWSDGEELLEDIKWIDDTRDMAIFIHLKDGTTIKTGYANVIIIEK